MVVMCVSVMYTPASPSLFFPTCRLPFHEHIYSYINSCLVTYGEGGSRLKISIHYLFCLVVN